MQHKQHRHHHFSSAFVSRRRRNHFSGVTNPPFSIQRFLEVESSSTQTRCESDHLKKKTKIWTKNKKNYCLKYCCRKKSERKGRKHSALIKEKVMRLKAVISSEYCYKVGKWWNIVYSVNGFITDRHSYRWWVKGSGAASRCRCSLAGSKAWWRAVQRLRWALLRAKPAAASNQRFHLIPRIQYWRIY